MKSQTEQPILPDVNQLIIEKLKSYPDVVSQLARKAIQLAEELPQATVFDVMQGLVREAARATGGKP